jgi:CO/xanthine dehydrogenase FAD-binding subunit
MSEVLEHMAAGAWTPLAGGTDLMVVLAAGSLPPGRYLSIWQLDELRGIEVRDDAIVMGALTTYSDVREHPILRAEFPMLVDAARLSGAIAIQNRGTLGGNVVNASPAADSPPALLAYDAEIELVSSTGTRTVPYASFHTGYKATVRRADELLARIRLPRRPAGAIHLYRKVGTRRAQAIAKVGLAAVGEVANGRVTHLRLGFSSVAPVPLRAVRTEQAVVGRDLSEASFAAARSAVADEVVPIDDVRSTASYRLRVAGNLVVDFLRVLADRTR